ncbi:MULTISPECIES: DNA adenine methylase [Psychromonas]|uniref:DNA adenine methylase n=1 Tax=Psychromonas TaxID=67572 RepID=UPI002FD76EEE
MAITPSPLRYPGGKTSILPMVSKIIEDNNLGDGDYAEPYAGGGGLALSLLFNDLVNEIHLNDIDRSIWSFWHTVLNDTESLIDKIKNTDITIDEWHIQRNIQQNKNDFNDFELAYSSFFLNRTNRSGIILKAGVIGGLKQAGDYKLDCRFNKSGLIERIKRIYQYRHRIHLYNLDAVDFIQKTNEALPENSMYCIDPPYFAKGSSLYTNFYNPDDHKQVSEAILKLDRPWILTYDNAPEIEKLYSNQSKYRFNLNYSAAKKRKGTELLITSNNIEVCPSLELMNVA